VAVNPPAGGIAGARSALAADFLTVMATSMSRSQACKVILQATAMAISSRRRPFTVTGEPVGDATADFGPERQR